MAILSAWPTDAHGRWKNILSMTAVAALSFLLYRRALSFAFFNDDPTGHFAWMASRSFADFFTSSANYGYYRPVVFATLQSLVSATGYNPAPFHALLILLHAANVALLWLLAFRLGSSRPYAWAAALVFATAPFSYEAVAYVASLTHPLLLFWLLLTLLLYQTMRAADTRGQRWTYGVAAYMTLILGLLTHENGLFIVPALVGVEWLARPPKGVLDGFKRPFLPYFVAPALYLLLWLGIPKNSEQGLAGFSDWITNLLPFLQSLVYPLLPLITLSAEQTMVLLLLALLTLAVLFTTAWWGRRVPLWLFGLGWFFLSALPATLFLTPDYVYGSPRLQYLPSVGVALLWALPVPAMLRFSRQKWSTIAAGGLSAVYTLALILPPLSFITCELDFYAEGSRIVRQMAEVAAEAPTEQALTFVNVPFYFSSYAEHPQGCANPYPWTPVGTVVVPPYAAARDFVRFNGGPDRPLTAVSADIFAPGWNTFGPAIDEQTLREKMAGRTMSVFDLNGRAFFNLSAAWQPGQAAAKPLATFGEGLALVDTAVTKGGDGAALDVDLRWQVTRPWDSQPVVFVHLYDNNALVAQHDGPPGGQFVPSALWQSGDIIVDAHRLVLPEGLAAGEYFVGVGLYDPLTAERFSAQAGQESLVDNLFIIERLTLP